MATGAWDLKQSKPDVIMTGARFLAGLGWRRGEALAAGGPSARGSALGAGRVRTNERRRSSGPLGGCGMCRGRSCRTAFQRAALLLPMGRRGPAFLAYPNLDVFLRWNQSLVYSTTAAYFATRLAGAKKVRSGRPEPGLSFDQMRWLQQLLSERGYDVGKIDGILGARTRDAVRREQLRLDLPADSWPTRGLLSAIVEEGDATGRELP